MAIVKFPKTLMSIHPRGRFGYTKADRLGERTYEEALAENPYAGIYRRRRIKGKLKIQQVPFYTPSNPQTEIQQAWRAKFAQAVAGWQSLSNEEKNFWRKYGRIYKMTGMNKYISQHIYLSVSEMLLLENGENLLLETGDEIEL